MNTQTQVQNVVSTRNMDWRYETHGVGAVVEAAHLIADNKTVGFKGYKRNPLDSTEMTYIGTSYFGIAKLEDGGLCVRTSATPDLMECGSHSLIASWSPEEIVTSPVHIAAHLMQYLNLYYSDFFIENPTLCNRNQAY